MHRRSQNLSPGLKKSERFLAASRQLGALFGNSDLTEKGYKNIQKVKRSETGLLVLAFVGDRYAKLLFPVERFCQSRMQTSWDTAKLDLRWLFSSPKLKYLELGYQTGYNGKPGSKHMLGAEIQSKRKAKAQESRRILDKMVKRRRNVNKFQS